MIACSDESSAPANEDVLAFGRFQLHPMKRVLLKEGQAVAVGSRAMEILLALTERAGAILSNRELLRRVWPDTVVEAGTVRVHVGHLRKVFRELDPHMEYVQTVTGRGYRFVAPVSSLRPFANTDASGDAVSTPLVREPSRRHSQPPRVAPIIGRARSIRALVDRVVRRRLVTIVGPGGSGKTTVAVCVADTLMHTSAAVWRHGVCFVDLASIAEPGLVSHTLASALGIVPATEDPLSDILACLSKRSILLLLDNCEHVLEASARLAERVLRHAPQVHVLATSREPLRAMEESVYDLAPLEVPPDRRVRTRSQLLAYSAIRLFVERAGAHAGAEFSDEDLMLVAAICQRLAGNALAIEIAAAHVRLLGLKALAAGLQDDLYLSISGLNTAEPRHRTLRATFDRSYGLLSPTEQAVYRRVSMFVGDFDLDQVIAAVKDLDLTRAEVFAGVMSLVRKSLVVADVSGEGISYRLHDLIRAHACEKRLESEGCQSELSDVKGVV